MTIADVFLRDGLQAVDPERGRQNFPTSIKLEILDHLEACGVPEVEITGFVHPRVIPNLADADDLARLALARPRRCRIRALVPNLKGAQRALDAGMPKIAWLLAASPTYQRLNSNQTQEEGLAEGAEIARLAHRQGVEVVASIGTAFICPYEGVVSGERLLGLVASMAEFGLTEVWLGESLGLAGPGLIRSRVEELRASLPKIRIGLHLHTMAGLALANALSAHAAGVDMFDGSVGGVGAGIALPHHSLALGNVATEDLNYAFAQEGVATGIDQVAISELGYRVRALAGGGGSRAADFDSLERYLDRSRRELARLMAERPGDSSRPAAGVVGNG